MHETEISLLVDVWIVLFVLFVARNRKVHTAVIIKINGPVYVTFVER